MKISIEEYPSCFALNLTPENIAEAALLIRMGMNSTKKAPDVWASASGGTIKGGIEIGKRWQSKSLVPKV